MKDMKSSMCMLLPALCEYPHLLISTFSEFSILLVEMDLKGKDLKYVNTIFEN